MEWIVSKAEFARLAGVGPSAISNKLKNSKLKLALLGDEIDVNNNIAKTYLQKCIKQGKPGTYQEPVVNSSSTPGRTPTVHLKTKVEKTEKTETQKLEKPKKTDVENLPTYDPETQVVTDILNVPSEIMDYTKYTLMEICVLHGSQHQFLDYVKSLKTMQEVETKDIANKKTRGSLISLKVLDEWFVDPLNITLTRILTDGKKTITQKLQTAMKVGKNIHEMEAIFAEHIGQHIGQLKETMGDKLKEIRENAQ